MAQKITLTVSEKKQLTPNIFEVHFRLVTPTSIDFKAGQNMMLMIAPGVNRTMSIASAPSASSELLMVHDVSPMGPGSKWTIGLKVGDTATIVAPTGGALSYLPTSKRKVLIATGTGIAPFHAMVADFLEHRQGALQNTVSVVIYWGLRHESDIYWKNEFDDMAKRDPMFTWHLILSKPTETWQGMRGHVTEHVLANEKDMQNSEFYLCGNKAMIEEVRAKLLEQNVPAEQIKSELFF